MNYKMEKLQLTTSEIDELKNIAKNQPVFSGNLSSSNDAKSLIDKKLVLRYEGEYCLTEKGKNLMDSFIKVTCDLRDSGIIYKNKKNEKSI